MRKFLAVLVASLLALAALTPAHAQIRSDVAIDRAQLQSDYQAIVAVNLTLSEDQAKVFWPQYRQYRTEMAKVGDRMVELVLGYAKSIDTLTDEQAAKMLDDWFSIKRDEIKVRSAWAPKFRKLIPTKSVTRLFQIENKLDAMIMFDAAAEIPLVEDAK